MSIQWNDNLEDLNDYDLHCIEPDGNLIYFDFKNSNTTGYLDIDVLRPEGVAVENITWTSKDKMKYGIYQILVHNYKDRNGVSGFKSEIEINNKIHSFARVSNLKVKERILIAKVLYNKDGFKLLDTKQIIDKLDLPRLGIDTE
jgi:uncharacterized protein YfaP (DUF2135 family)